MSASSTSLINFVLDLKEEVDKRRRAIHPSGSCVIHHWMGEMLEAANVNDAAEVKRLADNVQHKLRTERLW